MDNHLPHPALAPSFVSLLQYAPPCGEAFMPLTVRPFDRSLLLVYCSAVWSLITLLLLSVGPVYGEWVSLGEDQEGMTTYIDPATIRRKGNLVKMWILFDFRTTQTVLGTSYLSDKALDEYDCAEERRRTLAFTNFSGNMGSGRVVHRDTDEEKWEPVDPESIGLILWKLACGKK